MEEVFLWKQWLSIFYLFVHSNFPLFNTQHSISGKLVGRMSVAEDGLTNLLLAENLKHRVW